MSYMSNLDVELQIAREEIEAEKGLTQRGVSASCGVREYRDSIMTWGKAGEPVNLHRYNLEEPLEDKPDEKLRMDWREHTSAGEIYHLAEEFFKNSDQLRMLACYIFTKQDKDEVLAALIANRAKNEELTQFVDRIQSEESMGEPSLSKHLRRYGHPSEWEFDKPPSGMIVRFWRKEDENE